METDKTNLNRHNSAIDSPHDEQMSNDTVGNANTKRADAQLKCGACNGLQPGSLIVRSEITWYARKRLKPSSVKINQIQTTNLASWLRTASSSTGHGRLVKTRPEPPEPGVGR
jgi:hypothetical protein